MNSKTTDKQIRLDDGGTEVRDRRDLVRLDWYSVAVLVVMLVVAPLIAGDFATPTLLTADTPAEIFAAVGIPLLLMLGALAYVPFAWREWKNPVAIGEVPGLVPATALLALWSAISLIHTRAAYLSINALFVLSSALLMGALISRLARDRRAVITLLVAIASAGAVVACIGIREYIGFVQQHVPEHRSFSTFSDPNFLAGYLLLSLPIAMALFTCTAENGLKLLAAIAIVLQSACLWLSGSRSGSAIVLVSITIFTVLALTFSTGKSTSKLIAMAACLFLFGSLPALSPLLSRLHTRTPGGAQHPVAQNRVAPMASTDAQANSNDFRKWTWIGTARMASANPVIGTGIGAFEQSYPLYAETAFTIHAHNSYLQLMAETGYPGALFALAILAAAAAFIANALLLYRGQLQEARVDKDEARAAELDRYVSPVHSPAILLAGLLASAAGSMLHNFIDSDWYVAANLITIVAVVSVAVALARDIAPLSTRRPHALRKEILLAGALISVLFLWRGSQLTTSRMNIAMAKSDLQTAILAQETSPEAAHSSMTAASDAYRTAASADAYDPEPHLGLAELATTPEDRLRELKTAASICGIGKTYYRLGQFYVSRNEWESAIGAFEKAAELEPRMIQNLRALAGADQKAGKIDKAESTLHTITSLQHTPYGTVRAMHEQVETDFAFAHEALGDIATSRNDANLAYTEYLAAVAVFEEYWPGRNYLVNLTSRTPVRRKEIADSYETVLQQLAAIDAKKNDMAAVAARSEELKAVQADRAADAEAERRASAGGTESK